MSEEPEKPALTEAQQKALKKAWDLLCEHFESCIVVYTTTCKDDGTESVFDCNYHGGFTVGIGLAERAKHQWLRDDAGNKPDHWKEE